MPNLPCENEFILVTVKNHGFALNLALKQGLEQLGNNLFHAVFIARLPLSRQFFNEIVAYQELACVMVTLLACLCSHARRRQKQENQQQKLGISRALACAPFEAPWVRKFGYLCIQEILVLTKSSVRTSSRGEISRKANGNTQWNFFP